MEIVILGGTGFIGPPVVRRLCRGGHQVTVVHRGRTEAKLPPEVRHVHCPDAPRGDRSWLPSFAAEHGLRADVVLDMIPFSEADARAAVEAFLGRAGRLAAVSSQDVYRAYDRLRRKIDGPLEPVPLTENSPLRERLFPFRGDEPRAADDPHRFMDDYEKILVERTVLTCPELPGTVLRLAAVYGPGDGQHRFYSYVKRMEDRRPRILLDERLAAWRWTRGYVEDVAEAISLALTDSRAAGRTYNVGEPDPLPEAVWVRRIGAAAGWEGEVVSLPSEALPEGLRGWGSLDLAQHMPTDTTRIRRELGFVEPVPVDDGLRATIDWERAYPPGKIDPEAFDYAAEDSAWAALRGEPEKRGAGMAS